MNRSLAFAICALTVLAAGCTTSSARRPAPSPHYGSPTYGSPGYGQSQYVPPNAAGVQARTAETYSLVPSRQLATAFLYLPGSPVRQPVSYEVVNGMAVYEGDIMLGPAHSVAVKYGFPRLRNDPNVHSAVSVSDDSYLWPGGVIPYEIDGTVSAEKRSYVDWAVAHVTTQSMLTMRPRTPVEKDYVVFTESGGSYGCSSYVGRIGGAQQIRVADCGKGSVVHEIGHAAGFYHEQSRNDRDNYVTIAWNEISSGHEQWFKKREGATDIGVYDYASIMHYSRGAFSKSGKDTIIPKDPNANIGQREGLSALDKAGIGQLYAGGGPPVTPPGTTPPGTTPPGTTATGFAGTYTSSRGEVTCSESGATVNCSYPGGSMMCAANGSQLDCGWAGGGQGRAVFARQSNGDLQGTYGDFLSNNSRGAWDLVRTGGGQTTPPGTPPGTLPGLPTIPGLPPMPALPTIPGLPMPAPPQ
jgi:hypothetical protein